MRASNIIAILTIVGASIIPGMTAAAGQGGEVSQSSNYNITLAGLPVASASLKTTLYRDSYKMQSHFHSEGLAHVISEMEALTQSAGGLVAGRPVPDNYLLTFRRGKKSRRFDVSFTEGDVTRTVIDPAPKKRPKNWIEVGADDLKAVMDPLVALIRPGDKSPCEATLPVYDGEMRFDLVLTPKKDKPFSATGFDGTANVCAVRFQPRSGFRKGRSDLDYITKLKGIEIWFAKSARINAYAPVVISVPTKIGELRIVANRFDQ